MDTQTPTAVSLDETLAALPPVWPDDMLPGIRQHVAAGQRKLIVLDDDPTGTQTVHDIPVLTTWTVDALTTELRSPYPAIYILTNSRSLTAEAAEGLAREIGTNITLAADQADVEVEVISRSDSTLRGHFPVEVDALADTLGKRGTPYVIAPFFLEGGRFTIDDTHYVAEGDRLVPAAETSYARDAVFGYTHSNLRQWVAEKTSNRIAAEDVASISLIELREGGPEKVAARLKSLPQGSAVVVNAAAYRDLEVFVAGLLQAEEEGHDFLARTAASYVQVRAGIAPRTLLTAAELVADNDNGGVFIVGSYVPKTTAQLAQLMDDEAVPSIEVSVDLLLDDTLQDEEIVRVIRQLNRLVLQGRDVVVFTSRTLTTGDSDDANLEIGRRVSASLIAIVRGLQVQPRYLVVKGGITSSDVATKGLDVRRALVVGQVLPGVPVWKLGAESRYPGMAYIVFPGNVGDDNALRTIRQRLSRG